MLRVRCVKNALDILEKHEKVITTPEQYKDIWGKVFGNDNPVHVEFGCGKGGFIIQMAENNPNINYLAFEKNASIIVKAVNKMPEKILPNFYFVYSDIEKVEDIFNNNFIERIYLNFSDPWPKNKHTKRRLTHESFLKIYEKLLIPSGEIHFKTDNAGLFDFSMEELQGQNWDIKMSTKDLHNSSYIEGNVMTEYEEKFVRNGQPINKLIAVSPQKVFTKQI